MMLYRRDPERELRLLRAELKEARAALEAAGKAPWGVAPPRWLSGLGMVLSALSGTSCLYLGVVESTVTGFSAAAAWSVVTFVHYQNFKRAPKSAKER